MLDGIKKPNIYITRLRETAQVYTQIIYAKYTHMLDGIIKPNIYITRLRETAQIYTQIIYANIYAQLIRSDTDNTHIR
jgi:hypothetical protein